MEGANMTVVSSSPPTSYNEFTNLKRSDGVFHFGDIITFGKHKAKKLTKEFIRDNFKYWLWITGADFKVRLTEDVISYICQTHKELDAQQKYDLTIYADGKNREWSLAQYYADLVTNGAEATISTEEQQKKRDSKLNHSITELKKALEEE